MGDVNRGIDMGIEGQQVSSDISRELLAENQRLRHQLQEARETIRALRRDGVDALVVNRWASEGPCLFASPQWATATNIQTLLRVISESTGDVIFAKDISGRMIFANPAALQLIGKPLEQVLGRTDADFLDDKNAAARVMENDCRIMTQGVTEDLEEEVPLPNGASRIWLSRKVPYRDAEGEVVGLLGVSRDITERKRAEITLRESHARLKKVLEIETVGVVFWDLTTGCLVDANDTFLRMMGYSRSDVEAHGLTWQKFTPPEYHEVSLAEIRKFQATGRVGPYEKQYFRKDGTRQWLLFAGSSLGGDSCVEFCVDIADRKRAEESLRRSEGRWNAAIENFGEGAIIATEAEQVIYWNPAARRMHGLTDETEGIGPLMETPLTFELRTLDGERELALDEWPMRRIKRGETVRNLELRLRRPDQEWEKIVSYSGVMVETAGGERLIFLSVYDLTELRQAEAALRASLREKEVLLKEIHHRVKNNMQVISSLVALQSERLQEASMRAILQDVTDRVRSMALVHEKLYQSADMARVDFAEYVQSLLGYLWRAHGTAAASVRLSFDVESVQLSVNAAVPCGLILNELATNALKHAFQGRGAGEVVISLHGALEGNVCLRVRDNGAGLPPGLDWRRANSLGLRIVRYSPDNFTPMSKSRVAREPSLRSPLKNQKHEQGHHPDR